MSIIGSICDIVPHIETWSKLMFEYGAAKDVFDFLDLEKNPKM
jgi:hypothetical protein